MLGDWLELTVNYVWGLPLVVLVITTGLFLTIRLGVPQVWGFRHAWQILLGKFSGEKAPGEISHLQALSTALSATLGNGNIAGVAIAIAQGGPGALVWMWMIGFLGMAVKAASCTLAVRYRRILPSGKVLGGPMHYIELGLGSKWKALAILFALLVTIGSFGGGNMFQAKQVSEALHDNFAVPKYATGLVLVFFVGLVILGGIRRIGRVAGKLVPFMSIIYAVGAITVVALNAGFIPDAFILIFTDAFTGEAVAGGLVGEVIRQGVRRGTFSNEAGIGTAPIAHAAATTKEPTREGLIASLGPFLDTIVVCTLTGLVIVFSGAYLPFGSINQVNKEQATVRFQYDKDTRLKPGEKVVVKAEEKTLHERKLGTVEITKLDKEKRMAWAQIPTTSEGKLDFIPAEGNKVRLLSGASLTTKAFDRGLMGFGTWFVSLAVALFAFSTMLSWSYYGEEGAEYLFGEKAVLPYKFIFLIAVFTGAMWNLGAVVSFSDIAFGLMAVPNIIALWLLSGRVRAEHKQYREKMKTY